MTTGAAPASWRNTTPAPAFVSGLRRHGDRPAIVTEDGVLSYRDLDDRVDAVAARLAGPRRLVLVAGGRTPEAVVAYLAALRAGHVVLLGPAEGPADELVATWDPDLVVDVAGGLDLRRHRSRHALHPDLALLMATSGSTGSPRLVRLAAASLDANAAAIAEFLGITPVDRAVTTLPLHYCYGLSVVHSALLAGAALLLTDRSVTDPAFWRTVREQGGTALHGVPHTFELLDRVGFAEMDLPDLRYITQAGGRLAPHQVCRWTEIGRRRGWDLVVMYGQTEATARMAYLPPALAGTAPDAVGVAVPGGHLEVLDPDERGVGEIVYRGPNVMLGYATTPADLALSRTVDTLATGDLGRIGTDGLLRVAGRRARFAKPLGVRIDLDALEYLLADHGIHAVTVARGDDGVLVAVEDAGPSGRHKALDARVRAVLTDRLPLPAVAITVAAVPELPRLASGKLDRSALATPTVDGHCPGLLERIHGDRSRPRTVRDVLARAFPGQILSDDATFVDLGGDSLTYVQVSVDLERVLGHLPDDWESTPLGELTAIAPRARRPWTAVVETGIVLRALAVVLVVGEHTHLWTLLGGAHLLLAVAGWTFSRFVLSSRREGAGHRSTSRRIVRSAALIAVPSSLWIAFRAATQDDVRWTDALLGGSVFHPLVQGYWFVDALVQILVVLAALFGVGGVRRLDAAYPFALPAVLLLVAQALRLVPTYDDGVRPDLYSTHLVLWLFVLGWCVHRAASRRQQVMVAFAVVALVGSFFGGDLGRSAVVACGLLMLLLVPRLRLPRFLARPLTAVASASLGIYLTHFALLPLASHGVPAAALAPAGLVLGVATWRVTTALLGCREATRTR